MKLRDAFKDPKSIIFTIGMHGGLNFLNDRAYLKLLYWSKFGKKLNLDNPKTFNEKLQWLKLHNTDPLYTRMVDKYEAKKYVADIIGEEYIIPTLGVWDHFDEIDFEKLPNQFVLKCTHDSGGLVICRDKSSLDLKEAKKKIERSLKRNYYWVGRELPYKNVKPRIIAEQYMEDSTDKEIRNNKFFTFDGVAKALFIASDSGSVTEKTKFDFYDMNFEHLDLINGQPNSKTKLHQPETFEKMKEMAELLEKKIPHLRADFYEVNGKAYFGELTFSHWSGFVPFEPKEWNEKFSQWIRLPEETGGGYISVENGFVLHMCESRPKGLIDYKFYCFNGKVQFLYISQGLEHHETARISFVMPNWDKAPFSRCDYKEFDRLPPKPDHFKKMLCLSEVLSSNIPFIRVDFYEIDGRLYFGEITFTPMSGFHPFKNEFTDEEIGKLLLL